MPLTNTAKPAAGTQTNTARVSDAELWSTIESTWASETRTWLATGSEMTNTAKPKTLGAYTFDEIGERTIEDTPGVMDDGFIVKNTPRPSD